MNGGIIYYIENKKMAYPVISCISQTDATSIDLEIASIYAYKEPSNKKGDGFITFEFEDGRNATWKYLKEQRDKFMVDMAMIQKYDGR